MSVLEGARCAHPEELAELAVDDSRWPDGQVVGYWLDLVNLPASVTARDAFLAIVAGINVWPPVCGVRLALAASAAAAQVVISFAQIDPSGRMLGLTQLPEAGIYQLTMRLNQAVQWTADELAGVSKHEFGHALGLGHAPMATAAVMNPYYQPEILGPQPWDVEQAVERYPGPPEQAVPPVLGAEPAPASMVYHADLAGPVDLNMNLPSPGNYRITVEKLPS